MISPQSRLALDTRARFRRFENEGIVINQKSAEAIVVSEVAARIIELSDGHRTLDQCSEILAAEFDAEARTIREDVLAFASQLVEAGVAEVV